MSRQTSVAVARILGGSLPEKRTNPVSRVRQLRADELEPQSRRDRDPGAAGSAENDRLVAVKMEKVRFIAQDRRRFRRNERRQG